MDADAGTWWLRYHCRSSGNSALEPAYVRFTRTSKGYTLATAPRIVPDAVKLQKIGYEEMLELATYGAGVMAPRVVELGQVYGMPIAGRFKQQGHCRHPHLQGGVHGTAQQGERNRA